MGVAVTVEDEIRRLAATWQKDFVVPVEAKRLREFLMETNPVLLDEWLASHAEVFLAITIQKILTKRRSESRSRVEEFHAASRQAAETGEPMPPFPACGHFCVDFVIGSGPSGPVRRLVADMNGADHLFVSRSYQRTGNRDLMLGEFHRAIAKKVGDLRTADVFTEDEYDALLHTFDSDPDS